MAESRKNIEDKKTEALLDTWASSRIAVFGQVSIMVVFGMTLFAGVGYLLDQKFGSFPGFFIAGLVIAFPSIQFLIYKKIKAYSLDKTTNLK